jgi:hypothetical protein
MENQRETTIHIQKVSYLFNCHSLFYLFNCHSLLLQGKVKWDDKVRCYWELTPMRTHIENLRNIIIMRRKLLKTWGTSLGTDENMMGTQEFWIFWWWSYTPNSDQNCVYWTWFLTICECEQCIIGCKLKGVRLVERGGGHLIQKYLNITKWVQKNFECTVIAKEHSGNIHLSRFKEPNLVMGGSSLRFESTKSLKCKSF